MKTGSTAYSFKNTDSKGVCEGNEMAVLGDIQFQGRL